MCLFYPQQAGVIIQSHSAVFLPLLVSGGLIPVADQGHAFHNQKRQ
jgi:hypothetical protein